MPKYKHGKITTPIDFLTFLRAMKRVRFAESRTLSYKSFLAFIYWFGVRKAEALERTRDDFQIKGSLLIVNVPAKKGGEREALEIPVNFPFVHLIIDQVKKTRRTKKNRERRVWNFSPRTAITIVKRAMGDRYYPHFFRLNRATRFLEDPETTLPEMMAWFGWKAAKTVDPYIGHSRRHIHKQRERLSRELEEAGV